MRKVTIDSHLKIEVEKLELLLRNQNMICEAQRIISKRGNIIVTIREQKATIPQKFSPEIQTKLNLASVDDLNISKSDKTKLKAENILTQRALIELTEYELLQKRGIHKRVVKNIKHALEELGYSLTKIVT